MHHEEAIYTTSHLLYYLQVYLQVYLQIYVQAHTLESLFTSVYTFKLISKNVYKTRFTWSKSSLSLFRNSINYYYINIINLDATSEIRMGGGGRYIY